MIGFKLLNENASMGKPKDIAALVSYLAKLESAFIDDKDSTFDLTSEANGLS
jgi:hypothetical protein